MSNSFCPYLTGTQHKKDRSRASEVLKKIKKMLNMFGGHVEAKLEAKSTEGQRTSLMVLATSMPKLCAMKPCLRNRGDAQNKSAHAQNHKTNKYQQPVQYKCKPLSEQISFNELRV